MNAGFHGGQRLFQPIGNFLLGQAPEVKHLDHLALLGIEFQNRASNHLVLFALTQSQGGGEFIHGVDLRRLLAHVVLKPQAPLHRAQAVDRLVPSHRDGPSHWLAALQIIHRGFLPEHEHHLLGHILGVGLVVQNPVGGAEHDSDVTAEKTLIRHTVSAPHALDEIHIVYLGGLCWHRKQHRVSHAAMQTTNFHPQS